MSVGWRQQLADVVSAIRATLADATHAGSITAAEFLAIQALPATFLGLRAFVAMSAEIDWLTVGSSVTLIPQASPIGSLSGKRVLTTGRFCQLTQLTGTVVAAPTWKAGNNGSNDNFQGTVATGTGTTTAAVGQAFATGGGVLPIPAVDMTAGDIVAKVVAAATGTGLTVFKSRFVMITMVTDL
jgi:hypothetical protein